MTWETVPLGTIADLRAGIAFPPALQGRVTGPYPFAKVGDIGEASRSRGGELSTARNHVGEADLAVLRATPVPALSTLFAKIGESLRLNARAFNRVPVLIDNNAMAAVPLQGVDPRFLYRFLQQIDLGQIASTTSVPSLRKTDLARWPIPLPPLPEQRRIAAILDEADALRERKTRAVNVLQDLEVSTFRDRVARLQTQRVRLRSVAITTSGGTPSRSQPENFGGAVPWVKSGEVAQGIVTSTSETITELALQRSSAKVMPAGTVVIAMYGATAGEVGVLGVDAATNQAVCSITPAESLDAGFLRRSLLAMKEDLKSKAVGGAQPNLSQGMIRDINLDLPAVAEQRAVVQICDEIANMRSTGIEQNLAANALFASLQHRAFRGEL